MLGKFGRICLVLLRVLIGVDSELLEDIRVEEEAEYLLGRLDIDVTR